MKMFILVPSKRDWAGFTPHPDLGFVFSDKGLKDVRDVAELEPGTVLLVLNPEKIRDRTKLLAEAVGIFVHPGGRNTPRHTHALEALETLGIDKSELTKLKVVAFSVGSPDQRYKVAALKKIWPSLNGQTKGAQSLVIEGELKHDYEALKNSDDAHELGQMLVRIVIMLHGVWGGASVRKNLKDEWKEDLKDTFDNRTWAIYSQAILKEPAEKICTLLHETSDLTDDLPSEAKLFIEAVRKFIKTLRKPMEFDA
jgi:hypothetical protein